MGMLDHPVFLWAGGWEANPRIGPGSQALHFIQDSLFFKTLTHLKGEGFQASRQRGTKAALLLPETGCSISGQNIDSKMQCMQLIGSRVKQRLTAHINPSHQSPDQLSQSGLKAAWSRAQAAQGPRQPGCIIKPDSLSHLMFVRGKNYGSGL